MDRGMVISGGFGNILVREKKEKPLEIGELLIGESPHGHIILKIFDLLYGSQLSQQHLELISGLKLEEDTHLDFFEPHLRAYTLARLKPLVIVSDGNARTCKTLPPFLSSLRDLLPLDVRFLIKPDHPLFTGNLRSGSKVLDVPVYLDGVKALRHHLLITATTGKGKSNLTSVMLWQATREPWCGLLVLDPHDEYIGRNGLGLKDHSCRDKVIYYSSDPFAGGRTLAISMHLLKPSHFHGVMTWSDPQRDCIHAAYRAFGEHWIERLLTGEAVPGNFGEGTIAVVKRRLSLLLDLEHDAKGLACHGPFSTTAGATTPHDIVTALSKGSTVIIDTSWYDGSQELLIGSLLANEILLHHKRHLSAGTLTEQPVIGIFLEEAPRVLGKDVLERGGNIFSTIAREGRKFKVGLVAITQLPSLIPREILANINTKLILGVEMKPERQAIIESAAQDLSDDDRAIASLDRGEAIISSNFAPFAIPVMIPAFSEYAKQELERLNKQSAPTLPGFAGITS